MYETDCMTERRNRSGGCSVDRGADSIVWRLLGIETDLNIVSSADVAMIVTFNTRHFSSLSKTPPAIYSITNPSSLLDQPVLFIRSS